MNFPHSLNHYKENHMTAKPTRKVVTRNVAIAGAITALSLLLSPAMAMATPTSPTDVADTTLIVTDLLPGDTVSAFRIADADIDASRNLTYTMAPGLPEAYDTIDEIAAVASDGTAFNQGSAMQAAASAIAAVLVSPDLTQVSAGDSVGLQLGSGYYLVRVTSTNGTTRVYQNMIIDASPEVINGDYAPRQIAPIAVKKTEVAIDKGVGPQYGAKTDQYSVGDMVPFRVTTAVPSYPADAKDATFIVEDTPTAGLEIDTTSIMINGAAAQSGVDYTLTATANGYEFRFAKAWVLAHPGDPVQITYNAKVTDAAFSRSADDVTGNTATITFNPNPYDSATAMSSDKATVQTYGYVFKKTTPDGDPLAGAVFTITLANGTQVTSTSGQDGYVYFEDLGAGQYTAVETTVPAGYRKVADQVFELGGAVAVADNPATAGVVENNYLVAQADVVDPAQPVLPATGGSGALLLSGAGTFLLVIGAALGVSARRRRLRV